MTRFAIGLVVCALAWSSVSASLAQEKKSKSKGKAKAKETQQVQSDPAATAKFRTAAALERREQYSLAADEWAEFIETFPEDARIVEVRYRLGFCRFKSKEYEPALAVFEKLTQEHPDWELASSALLFLGLTQYNLAQSGETERFAEADATFAALVERFPEADEVPQALYYAGESLYAQENYAAAAQRYAELVSDHANDALVPDALYALGVAREELQQSESAAKAYETFLRQFPEHALATEVRFRRGESLFALGQFADAGKLFAEAASDQGFTAADQAMVRQADCLAEVKKYDQAAVLYASLARAFPRSKLVPSARLAAGRAWYLAGDYDSARKGLAPLLNGDGEAAAEAAHWTARACLKESDPDEALDVVDAALAKGDTGDFTASLHMDRADALYESPARRAESVAAYAQIARSLPQDVLAPQALYNAAFAAFELGDFESAGRYAEDFQTRFAAHELAAGAAQLAAESALQLGRYADAVAIYTRLLAAHAEHAQAPTWHVRRARGLFLQQKHRETISALEDVIESLGDAALVAEARFLSGSSRRELGQFDGAITDLRGSLEADPNWRQADETRLALALAYHQSGDDDSARAHLERLISRQAASRVADRAHYWLGEIAYAAGDFAGAAASYQRVVDDHAASPLVPFAWHGLGWALLSSEEFERAVAAFDAVLAGPDESGLAPQARFARAQALHRLDRFDQALNDLTAFLESGPVASEACDALYLVALCQVGLDDPAAAEATLRKILADNPGYTGSDKVLFELAWTLKAQDKEDEASQIFTRITTEHAQSPLATESWFHVGEQLYSQADFDRAAGAYQRARAGAGRTPLAEEVQHKLAWAWFKAGKHEQAQAEFQKQQADFPNGRLAGDAAFMEGECYYQLGKFREALDCYGRMKDPAGKDFEVLGLVHAAQAAAQLDDFRQSLDLLKRAEREFPQSDYLPQILCEQGWAQQQLENEDEALALYERVTETTRGEVAARARFLVGEIYFARRQHAQAVKEFFEVAFAYNYPKWQAAAHYEAGRCFEVLEQPEQARESYREVVENFPDSEQAPLARERLDALETAS